MGTKVNFADCYVLTDRRTKAFITSFLEAFLPERQEAVSQYEVPQYAEQPEQVFYTAHELIGYLEQNGNVQHAIYWLNRQVSTLRGAMTIFTSGGQVILGLFCEILRPDTRIETTYLRALQAFCDSESGLIEYEQPAPEDTAEYLKRLNANGFMK